MVLLLSLHRNHTSGLAHRTMSTTPEIFVFYHLFAIDGWQEIWNVHRRHLVASGLYDACGSLLVGVVYKDRRHLSAVRAALDDLPKASVLFSRELDAPALLWPEPTMTSPNGRMGEGETILRMTHYAQQRSDQCVYLFLHSKGVSRPSWRTRKHLAYFVRQGLTPSATDEQTNEFVLRHLNSVVTDWKKHVANLRSGEASFAYRLFNFFWVRGSLLHRFELTTYVSRHAQTAPPAHRKHVLTGDATAIRHLFALFPIKLFAFANGVTLCQPPHEYIDVAM